MSNFLKPVFLAVISLLALTSCGQSGPLYLPDPQEVPHVVK